MLKIECSTTPDELARMDAIMVNGVEFVPKARHDGVKQLLVKYLNDACKMMRARDELVRDILAAMGSDCSEELRARHPEFGVRAEKLFKM